MAFKDPEKAKEYQKEYWKTHVEERRKIGRDWRINNPEKAKAMVIKYRLAWPERQLMLRAKKRAKDKGREFALTEADVFIPETCPLLGIPLFKGSGAPCDNSPSLDRIDNSKGYVPGNVWVISRKANTMKSDATLEELETLTAALRAKLARPDEYTI